MLPKFIRDFYRRADRNREKMSPVVMKPAQRFANLLQARSRLHAAQTPRHN